MTVTVIRTDASQKSGSGHVMRCLTLAEELRDNGLEIIFITRDHNGSLVKYIRSKEFEVYSLLNPNLYNLQHSFHGYEKWLGVTQEQDAEETICFISDMQVDWMIVDHYAIDQTWEKKLRPYVKKMMVIDDLANRKHDCDLLLDQNYIPTQGRYDQLVLPNTIKLLGPKYALLRKDFTRYSTTRKLQPKRLTRVFVFFGGSDLDNLTVMTLKALAMPGLQHLFVDVVIGLANSHQAEIKKYIEDNPKATLHIQIDNIAEIMSNADIALGAGGTTTWERMSLGIPSIVVTTAENQVPFTKELDLDGYINWVGSSNQVDIQIIYDVLLGAIHDPQRLHEQSKKCKKIVSMTGTKKISNLLLYGLSKEYLTIRYANKADRKQYFYWANVNLGQEKLEEEEYQVYFDSYTEYILIVVESEFGVVGYVKFYRRDQYNITCLLNSLFHKYDLSKCIVSRVINYIKHDKPIIDRGIKGDFAISKKVFNQLRFIDSDPYETTALGNGKKKSKQLSIVILSDSSTWMNRWIAKLLAGWLIDGHIVSWVSDTQNIPKGDLCFILSYENLVEVNVRNRNKNNLVVHASDLPKGKGWSPMSWQVLEGKNEIVVTLFEAEDDIDSGDIYLQDIMNLDGYELVDDLRRKQAEITLNLCCDFVNHYPAVLQSSRQQQGTSTFYPKRKTTDSCLDPNKTIGEQFNLLRIVDNDKYPAYFKWNGQSYILKVEKLK